jgi:hypothetical protein
MVNAILIYQRLARNCLPRLNTEAFLYFHAGEKIDPQCDSGASSIFYRHPNPRIDDQLKQGARLLEAVAKGHAIVTPKLDRIFRSAADALATLEQRIDTSNCICSILAAT